MGGRIAPVHGIKGGGGGRYVDHGRELEKLAHSRHNRDNSTLLVRAAQWPARTRFARPGVDRRRGEGASLQTEL